MDEFIMGKSVSHYKKIIYVLCICLLLLFSTLSSAALREDELFEKAYENYLSYHPEKALEYFNIFLEDFPDSSAKDAALFWKAKSLMQLKRTDEALKIFNELKRTLPGSPFVPFMEKELAVYKNNSSQPVVKKEATERKDGK